MLVCGLSFSVELECIVGALSDGGWSFTEMLAEEKRMVWFTRFCCVGYGDESFLGLVVLSMSSWLNSYSGLSCRNVK